MLFSKARLYNSKRFYPEPDVVEYNILYKQKVLFRT
jgi:hypothetical protein